MNVTLKTTSKFSVLCLDEDPIYKRFLQLSANVPYEEARNTSRLERELDIDAPNLTYGEVTYHSLATILGALREYGALDGEDQVFVDLGSGCGRPIVAAALLHKGFRRLIGIEILGGLHQMALRLKQSWDALHIEAGEDVEERTLEFVHGSILNYDWAAQADVVLANSTCFGIPFWAEIEALSKACKPGCYFVSLTFNLGNADKGLHWDLLETMRLEMSWGEADICIHRRR